MSAIIYSFKTGRVLNVADIPAPKPRDLFEEYDHKSRER